MRRFFVGTLVLATLLTLYWWVREEHDFERAATRAALSYEMKDQCPLDRSRVRQEDLGLLSICATYGLTAYEAARRYPEEAPTIFAIYGELTEFHEILERYGHTVIPIIEYFRNRNSREFRFRMRMQSV